MAIVNLEGTDPPSGTVFGRSNESSISAVSWPAVMAGTVVAVSVTFVLTLLGSGIGFASMSHWPHRGVSATTFTMVAAIWLIVVQWGSAAIGGYTTGRLRTKWAGLHTHEVFFRDTAHGLVTWATATVIGALLLAGAALHTAGHGMQAAATVATATTGRAGHEPQAEEGNSLYVDRLFRSTSAEPVAPARYSEATRVLNNAVTDGTLSADDHAYLTHLVAARSAIPSEEAQKRVDDTLAQMKAAADEARAAAAKTSVFMALSMLIGAFVACAAAALGGKRRDEHL
jgi:hypothetical protein